MYVNIMARYISQKNDDSQSIPNKWFPNAKLCGKEDIWQEYTDYHTSVLSGKQKENI